MRIAAALTALALAGCATGNDFTWEKAGGTQDEFHRDRGQCMQATFSMPFAAAQQQMAVYSSCMQGKGWYAVPTKR